MSLERDAVSQRVGGATHLVGVIGWPVAESLSPVIHNAAFASLGLDWVYMPLPVEPGHLPAACEGLAALGFAGANVTMPHKEEASGLMTTLSEDAELSTAVNTIVVWPEGLAGHNTDVGGFVRFLQDDAGFDPAGRSALIYGAGGAARACALALGRMGLAAVTLAARNPERATPLRDALHRLGVETITVPWLKAPSVAADVVVNATPLGAGGEELPLPALGAGNLVVDLVYRPAATPLVAQARRTGAVAFGGLGLLLHQAALSFELWTGQPPPIDVMSAAALAELADTSP